RFSLATTRPPVIEPRWFSRRSGRTSDPERRPRRRRRDAPKCLRKDAPAMKLYPKAIPAIARDVVAQLMADGDVEVETLRIADAEQDMASVMKEYLAAEERVNQATREALERRGHDHSKFFQVKRE